MKFVFFSLNEMEEFWENRCPGCPQDEILSTVGESAPLMYIDNTHVDIEVM